MATTPQFYNVQFALEMMEFFRANNWRGAQASIGNSSKLALLTRLAGGMGQWKGDKKFEDKYREKRDKGKTLTKKQKEALKKETEVT